MKTKSPEANGQLAKKAGETAQFTFGIMTVKSKDINLVIHGKMVSGITKKLKAFFRAADLKMKINVPNDISIATLREDFLDFSDEMNFDAMLEPSK